LRPASAADIPDPHTVACSLGTALAPRIIIQPSHHTAPFSWQPEHIITWPRHRRWSSGHSSNNLTAKYRCTQWTHAAGANNNYELSHHRSCVFPTLHRFRLHLSAEGSFLSEKCYAVLATLAWLRRPDVTCALPRMATLETWQCAARAAARLPLSAEVAAPGFSPRPDAPLTQHDSASLRTHSPTATSLPHLPAPPLDPQSQHHSQLPVVPPRPQPT
jgi:hypothetical protein